LIGNHKRFRAGDRWRQAVSAERGDSSMKKTNLKGLSFDQLLEVRDTVDKLIASMASKVKRELQERLAKLEAMTGEFVRGSAPAKRRSPLKGRKVTPKYRNPKNRRETWAGRGAMPRWLSAFVKQGRKLEEFSIQKAGRGEAKAKKSRRKRRK
jgi:DNA-binding protein H-NS